MHFIQLELLCRNWSILLHNRIAHILVPIFIVPSQSCHKSLSIFFEDVRSYLSLYIDAHSQIDGERLSSIIS